MSQPLVPDILQPGLKVVFCGTALGHESYRQKAYYANPGNQFWKVLHRVGLTPAQLAPKEYARMPQFGLGLTDLCKRHFGNDHELPTEAFDRDALEEKIRRFQPDFLAFTSKKGASVYLQRATAKIPYGLQPETIGRTRLFVLPSPSARARSWWKEEAWEELASRIR
jgi:TDG/mug DNA glycosylase family protein